MAPTVTITILLAVLAIVAPLLAKYRPNPGVLIAKIQALSIQKPAAATTDPKKAVWVNRRSGLYYCRHSNFYGRIWPGFAMRQGSAIQRGFRPAEGKECP